MRGGYKITRSDYEREAGDKPSDWLDDFAKKLAEKNKPAPPKSAVEAARMRDQQSIVDQISSIMGNKSKHSSVESVVQEMHERTGLKEYISRQSAEQNIGKKIASNEVFQNFSPDIRHNITNFIKNRIETHHGLVPLPAIQEEILSTFKRDGIQPQDVNTPEAAKFINQLIIEERKKSPNSDTYDANLGRGVGVTDMDDADGANSDFFRGLLPITSS